MIREAHGDLLAADVDAIVNTVNTVGVMGKGIALQFKNSYPGNYKLYRAACARGEVKLGEMFVFDAGQLMRPRWVINFPTKGHWKSRSKLRDIEAGLVDLRRVLAELGVGSVALPPLGCGNGGLNWRDVEPMIQRHLADLTIDIVVYPPKGAPEPSAMTTSTARPRLTPGKAALVAMLSRYSPVAVGGSLIEVQKLMYFMQEAGQPLRLRFEKDRYGPYADNLRHVLQALEGHHLVGYGDGTKRVEQADPIALLPGAADEANAALSQDHEVVERMNRVLSLVEGFESPYGLELLATTHWSARNECPSDASESDVVHVVHAWSKRKQDLFTDAHIRVALDQLRELGWIAAAPAA